MVAPTTSVSQPHKHMTGQMAFQVCMYFQYKALRRQNNCITITSCHENSLNVHIEYVLFCYQGGCLGGLFPFFKVASQDFGRNKIKILARGEV